MLTGADALAPYGGAAFHDNKVWVRAASIRLSQPRSFGRRQWVSRAAPKRSSCPLPSNSKRAKAAVGNFSPRRCKAMASELPPGKPPGEVLEAGIVADHQQRADRLRRLLHVGKQLFGRRSVERFAKCHGSDCQAIWQPRAPRSRACERPAISAPAQAASRGRTSSRPMRGAALRPRERERPVEIGEGRIVPTRLGVA